MTEEIFKIGTKVWVYSLERAGMIVRVEQDARYGAQYLVSIHDPETIENTYPYIQVWIKNTDLESTIQSNKRGR
jgi:hypothetical protein